MRYYRGPERTGLAFMALSSVTPEFIVSYLTDSESWTFCWAESRIAMTADGCINGNRSKESHHTFV
jgi:hypothetical protein